MYIIRKHIIYGDGRVVEGDSLQNCIRKSIVGSNPALRASRRIIVVDQDIED